LGEPKSIAVNDSIEEELCDEKIEGRMKCFHKHARGSLEENGDKKVIIENVSCEGIYDHIIQSKRESTMGKSDSLDKINAIKESCENIIKLKTDSFSDPIGNTEEIIHSQSSQEAISVKEQFIVDDAIEDEMSDEKVEGEKSDDTIGISDVETAPDSEDAADQEDTKTDTNENFTPAHKEPLRIHMKANGDDNDLDSDLSQEEPKVIEISGGFGFFVN